ncbi:MAG: oligopeptide ABC transporter ATP-binding protein OppF, partial [Steroidobacteraceae bacterium]|nr:oligopeptide ABC transporter ATP-binding protein OppF [Steroidobacteraceae bacterium]
APRHPYTRALLACRVDLQAGTARRLRTIEGQPLAASAHPAQACSFAPRCSFATERCRQVRPELRLCGAEHRVACHHA